MFIDNFENVFKDNTPNVITNYLELRNILTSRDSILFMDLFEQMKDHRLRDISIVDDGIIHDGVDLSVSKKEKVNKIEFDSNKLIEKASQSFSNEVNDLDKAYYLKSLISLANNVDYIDEEEEFLFDCLFDDISLDDKHLEQNLKGERQYMMR